MSSETKPPEAAAPTGGTRPDSASGTDTDTASVPGDLAMTRVLWPFMLASAVGLVPFTIYSTFLVPMAEVSGGGVAALGQLRGLGGLAALAVGTALAPLIDRVRREWAAAGGLAVLAVSAALGASGEFLLLAAFCLLVGAGTAVLNPRSDRRRGRPVRQRRRGGRAATLITATQSLTALLAAPLVALPALVWGWQGDLWAIAAICAALALYFLLRGRRKTGTEAAATTERPGYLESFRLLGALPGVVPLILVAMLRTAAFMGYLASPRRLLRRAVRTRPRAVRDRVDAQRHRLLPRQPARRTAAQLREGCDPRGTPDDVRADRGTGRTRRRLLLPHPVVRPAAHRSGRRRTRDGRGLRHHPAGTALRLSSGARR